MGRTAGTIGRIGGTICRIGGTIGMDGCTLGRTDMVHLAGLVVYLAGLVAQSVSELLTCQSKPEGHVFKVRRWSLLIRKLVLTQVREKRVANPIFKGTVS